jgi:hypothetical protein
LCMKLLWHSSWVSQPCSSLVHKHHQLYRIWRKTKKRKRNVVIRNWQRCE